MWQECPVCKGRGEVLRDGFTNSVFQTCKVCKGARIISKLTGLPPDYELNKEIHKINEKEFLDKWIKAGENTYPLTYEEVIPAKNFEKDVIKYSKYYTLGIDPLEATSENESKGFQSYEELLNNQNIIK